MKNKKENKEEQISDFLKRVKKEGPRDDFEKEAAEGFALFENEAEARALKAELDKKMVTVGGSAPKRTYWYWAAAVLVSTIFGIWLFIGFEKPRELAVHSTPVVKAPETDLAFAETEEKENTAEEKIQPASQEKKKEHVNQHVSARASAQSEAVSEKQLTRERDKEATEAAMPPTAGQMAPHMADDEVKQPDLVVNQNAPPMVQNSQVYMSPGSSNAPVNSTLTASGASSYTWSPKAKSVQNTDAMKKSRVIETKNSCYYRDGEQALRNDLVKLLRSHNLLIAFDADLSVDRSGKIIAVKITESSSIDPEQAKRITEIVKKLDKFVFVEAQKNDTPAAYKLKFVP